MTVALRVVLALEFAAAIGTCAVGLCPWMIAGAVATGALTVFLFTWDDPCGTPCTGRVKTCANPLPLACRLLDHTDPTGYGGPCTRCGRWT